MFKDFLIVGAGSFLGGGLRFLVSRALAATTATPFPAGTFAVNIVGCLLIGFLSSLHYPGGMLSPTTRLLLTTGFCGGFTTFSTMMNENVALLKDGNITTFALYTVGSILMGGAAVVVGHYIGIRS